MNAVLEAVACGEALIAFAEADVGDVGVELFALADGQAAQRMIVAIGGQLPAFKVTLPSLPRLGSFWARNSVKRSIWFCRRRSRWR